jgi:peptide/nickel transport system permease protein
MSSRVLFRVCCIVLLAYIAVAVFAPWLAPDDPMAVTGRPFMPPDKDHPLGTNATGQDILSQLIYGTRVTLLVGFGAALISCTLSTGAGILTGYYGGVVDEVAMRAIDIFMTIPLFPLLLVLTLFFSPGIFTMGILMGVLGSAHGVRVVRSQVMAIRKAHYIEGARAIGAGDIHIMTRHVLPNILPVVTVKFVSSAQHYLLMGVGLSFLGLGDPMVIDWGQMIQAAYSSGGFALGLWWWLLPPGLAVVGISLALALLGYSTEGDINPRIEVNQV